MQRQLAWNIHKVAFLLEKRADVVLKKQLDIGYAQYKVLEAINHNSLAKQNAVAEMLDQTEASISRQVRILQKKGLIGITDVMGNKRARELTLTDIGEELVRSAEELLDLDQSEIFTMLSPKEQQWLGDALNRMLQKVKDR